MAPSSRIMATRGLAATSCLRSIAGSNKLPSNGRPARWLVQTRTKRSSAAKNAGDKKAAVSRAVKASSAAAVSSDAAAVRPPAIDAELLEKGVFGMRPVDYSVPPPIPISPPAPPAKPGLRGYYWQLVLALSVGTTAYFYLNNKNDNYAYWEAMQSGEALDMDDEDVEYEDDEEDEEEEEEEMMEETLDQLQQLNMDGSMKGPGGAEDNTKLTEKKRWFGWLRGWRREGVKDESVASDR